MSNREIFCQIQPPSTRSFGGVVVSFALHCAAAVGVYVLGAYLTGMTPQASRIAERLTFVNIVAPIEAPQKPRARLKVPELPRKELRPEPLPKVEHTEIQPLAPKPVFPEAPPTPKPVRRAPETVTVGAFNTPAPQARVPDPIRMVQATGFDDPSPRQPSPELKIGNAKVGAFQSAAAADVRSSPVRGSDTVADAGFAPVGAAQKQQPVARAIGDSGFGDAKAGERRTEPARVAQVQSGVFGNAEPTPQPRRATPSPERVETPVEIIVKPTPEYTKEARSQKIEGEVLLEVEFRASGEVRVLRVVRGLGYGLDESAARAAERIQFKPARSSKGPVNFRATVQIVFRLT